MMPFYFMLHIYSRHQLVDWIMRWVIFYWMIEVNEYYGVGTFYQVVSVYVHIVLLLRLEAAHFWQVCMSSKKKIQWNLSSADLTFLILISQSFTHMGCSLINVASLLYWRTLLDGAKRVVFVDRYAIATTFVSSFIPIFAFVLPLYLYQNLVWLSDIFECDLGRHWHGHLPPTLVVQVVLE